VSLVMKRVVQQVRASTLRQQNPEVLTRMASEFYFVPGTQVASLIADGKDEYAEVNAAFKAAMTVGTAQVWRDFIAHYPDTSLSDYARQALRDAEAEENVASLAQPGAPRSSSGSSLPADTITEALPASTDTAALPPLHVEAPDANDAQPAQAVTPTLSPEVLALQIQGELNRIGCTVGTPDGVWGKRSQQGLERYAKTASLNVATLDLAQPLLDQLRGVVAGYCPVVACSVKQNLRDGQCVAKSCPAGQKLSSKGACYKPATTAASAPAQPKKHRQPPKVEHHEAPQVPWEPGPSFGISLGIGYNHHH
jgi:hypothetical protein